MGMGIFDGRAGLAAAAALVAALALAGCAGAPAPAPAPNWGDPGAGATARVLELTNQARSKERACGREKFAAAPPVASDSRLARAAGAHAAEMARRTELTHAGADGSAPWDRAARAGFRGRRVGENVGWGQRTAEEIVAGWLASPGHCANLMNPSHRLLERLWP